MSEWPQRARAGRRRLIPAVESAECGLACVAMVANHHGHDVNLQGLRQEFGVSASGARLRDLMTALDGLGFQCRAVRLDLDALGDLVLPAILHWDMDHFVVLESARAGRFRILDPARGERLLSRSEVSASFTGVALEISRSVDFEPRKSRQDLPLSMILNPLEGWSGPATQVLLLTFCLQLVVLGVPVATQILIDDAVASGDLPFAAVLVAGLLAVVIFQALVEFVRGWTVEALRQSLSYQMTGNLVRHLLRLPGGWFDRRGAGDILSRIQSSNALRDILTRSGVDAISDAVMATVTLVALLLYSPLITGFVVLTVALQAALHALTFPVLRERLERQISALASEQGHLMESVRIASVTRLLGSEGRREQQWRSLYADVINATLRAARLKLGISTANNLLTGLRMVGVLGLGAHQITTGSGFSLGMLYAFVALQQMFSERSTGLIANLVQLRSMSLHLERMADIVLTSREYETGGAVSGSGLEEGPLELKDVSFRYGTFGAPVLEALSLTIAPGEFVAIIGSSGSGKSTLLKILLGLETPTSGTVLVNGLPLTGERLKAWRQQVGFVLQDDRLMSGSIAENISAFEPEPDQKRVEAAAKAAQVHADIAAMPMQYRSLIGEMGNALSGGQRQRLMLARALYRQPRFLIMDEGTANLDAVSEEQIADLVASLGITRISVSHRPAMVRKADKVLVLEQGRLWPGGTGEHLM